MSSYFLLAPSAQLGEIYFALDQREVFTILQCTAPSQTILLWPQIPKHFFNGKIKAAIATLCTQERLKTEEEEEAAKNISANKPRKIKMQIIIARWQKEKKHFS